MDVWFVWIIILILLILIEYYTVDFTTIWFVISSFVALLLSFFIESFWWQLSVFLVLGLVLLITTRPFWMKMIHRKRVKTAKLVGKKGRVIKKINKNQSGEVKINNQTWFAVADENLKIDDEVKVTSCRKEHVKVKKINNS